MMMIFAQEEDTQMRLFQMMVFAIRSKGERMNSRRKGAAGEREIAFLNANIER